MSKDNPKKDNVEFGLPEDGALTEAQMRYVAQRIGVLNLEKKELERELECLKYNLKAEILQKISETKTKTGSIQRILENVEGFTCKVYDRTQLRADQKKAKEILHANTFNAIFKPSTSTIVDVRPDARLKRSLVGEIKSVLGLSSKKQHSA